MRKTRKVGGGGGETSTCLYSNFWSTFFGWLSMIFFGFFRVCLCVYLD